LEPPKWLRLVEVWQERPFGLPDWRVGKDSC